MKSRGLIRLAIRIEEFRTRISLVLVQSLGVDCLLGTLFIDRHVGAILPRLRKAVFYHSHFVAIVSPRFFTKLKTFRNLEFKY